MNKCRLEVPKSRLAKALLAPASVFYQALVAARASAYNSGLAAKNKVSVPVISVGNITVGGTGKTPVTIHLARQLIKDGRKVAILSRGYGRQSKSDYVVASDGTNILCNAFECGDEPYMMAKAVPDAVVICGRSRTQIANLSIEKYGCDVLLLDDGFQHIRLHREINIVLLDYNDDLEKDMLLPAGRLREPLSALARATHIIITKVPQNASPEKLESIKQLVGKYCSACQIFLCRFELENTDQTRNKEAVAFAGIARPDQFFAGLKEKEMQITLLNCLEFPDHHWYQKSDIKKILESINKSPTVIGLTTKKDLVRLEAGRADPIFAQLLEKTVGVGLETVWIGDPLILGIK